MALTRDQRSVILASFLGWTLDAFDFFIMVFVFSDIAKEFHTDIGSVTPALMLTLAARPIGAFIFGRAADRFGRRPTLVVDILLYSVLELASGFAPSLTVLLVLRTLFGVAMGGEWGVGAALTMETIPANMRGLVSGLLQAGYPTGYLLASVVYGVVYPHVGWRGMFIVGAVPALLALYVRASVPESPSWKKQGERAHQAGIVEVAIRRWPLFIYAIVLMTAFNFFSHGTQDLYPNVFLKVQRGFSGGTVSTIAVIYNIGAIIGGLIFGAFSERIGRRRAIVIAAVLALPVIPIWSLSASPVTLAVGAFLMQFMVQGAWGVIPAHLNELSPPSVRATFPGFIYQLGNLLASTNVMIQTGLAAHYGGMGNAMAITVGVVAVAIALLVGFGIEARGVDMAAVNRAPGD